MNKNILITGGAGFIGSHFIRHLLKAKQGVNVINFDNLSYAADTRRLEDVEKDPRYCFVRGDIRDIEDVKGVFSRGIDLIVHFAAQTHVDNSIKDPFIFEEVNIRGTLNLLDTAREYKTKRVIHVSTDEVYGEIEEGFFSEESPLAPNSPYSASKAAADFFVRAYARTYGLAAVIVRPCNNYGPWQYPEKFMPVIMYKALRDEKVPVYGKGLNVREWLYVTDCARAIGLVLDKGEPGEIYNIGSGVEKINIDTVKETLKALDKPQSLVEFVKDRPGHDLRYCLEFSKIKKLGFEPEFDFERGIAELAQWSRDNFIWLEGKVRSLQSLWKEVYVKV